MKYIKLSIPQIHCISCEILIKMVLDSIDGVESFKIDSKNKTIDLEFDPLTILQDDIIQSIHNETGYKVVVL